jgi:DNA invertase Pin-like site-specific DNA recombinase
MGWRMAFMSKNPKYWGWARVSTDKQDFAAQKLHIYEFAEQQGFHVEEIIAVESGANAKLTDLKLAHLFDLAPANSNSIILTCELSRLGRSLPQIVKLVDERFIKEKRGLVCINDPVKIPTNGEMDLHTEILVTLMGLMASIERRLISERTKQGLQNARSKGKKLGRRKGSKVKSKLDQHKDDIIDLLSKGVPKTRVASTFNVAVPTVYYWLKSRNIKYKNRTT